MARNKPPKPSQIFVEIDEDEESQEPRLSGALRGLNPGKNIIRDETATRTIEDSESGSDLDVDVKPSPVKHTTRASRGAIHAVNYDMKYHPMDVITRPNSAAVRRQSKSVSFVGSEDEEDDNVSLPSSQGDSDPGSDTSGGPQDDTLSDAPIQRIRLGSRTPDPKAVRHSSRRAARKPVIYSSKHHPQDHGLPGYRHRAIIIENDSDDDDPAQELRGKRDSSEVEDYTKERGPARKKLRTINRTDASTRPKRGRGRPKKTQQSGRKATKRQSAYDTDVDDLVDMAVSGLPPPSQRPVVIPDSDDNSSEIIEELLIASKTAVASNNAHSSQTLDRTPDTSLTTAVSSGSVATPSLAMGKAASVKLMSSSALPTFIRDRISDTLVSEATVAQLFLESYTGVEFQGSLVINKPYLNGNEHLTEATPVPQKPLSLSQLPPVDQPYSHIGTPPSNEFEEQMAITEGAQLAHSDPINDLPDLSSDHGTPSEDAAPSQLEPTADNEQSDKSTGSVEL